MTDKQSQIDEAYDRIYDNFVAPILKVHGFSASIEELRGEDYLIFGADEGLTAMSDVPAHLASALGMSQELGEFFTSNSRKQNAQYSIRVGLLDDKFVKMQAQLCPNGMDRYMSPEERQFMRRTRGLLTDLFDEAQPPKPKSRNLAENNAIYPGTAGTIGVSILPDQAPYEKAMSEETKLANNAAELARKAKSEGDKIRTGTIIVSGRRTSNDLEAKLGDVFDAGRNRKKHLT